MYQSFPFPTLISLFSIHNRLQKKHNYLADQIESLFSLSLSLSLVRIVFYIFNNIK